MSFEMSTVSSTPQPQPVGHGAITWMYFVPRMEAACSTLRMKSLR